MPRTQHSPSGSMSAVHNQSILDIEDDQELDHGRLVNIGPFGNTNSNSNNIGNTNQMHSEMLALMERCNQLQLQLNQSTNTSNANNIENSHEQSSEPFEVYKVSTKVPPFYSDKPDLWFHQVEAQFRNNKITRDQTKYDHILSNLDPKYLDVIAHIIRDPPPQDKYEKIKSTLIKEFQHSDENRLRQLLQGIDLGDRKPSALLRQMREISKNMISDTVLETLWSSKLPETLRAIIACMNTSIEDKSEKADKIMDRSNFETSTTAYRLNSNVNSVQSCEFTAQIAALTKQVSELSNKFNNRPRSRSNSRIKFNNSKSSNTNNGNNENKKYEQCWYHFKFNGNARNCTDWCKFYSDFQKEQKN